MFQFRDLQNFVIAVFVFAQLVTRAWSFQNNVFHSPIPYNPYAPPRTSFLQRNPASSSWHFSNNAGVPTWVITTTVIETRNETVSAAKTRDDDSPVGPNLREDAMMAANENDDPDVEFPIKDGKDPAVHARPAFGDPDKYEETTSGPGEESAVNQTKPRVTVVNRTTVVKIEFHNTPLLPLVLNVGNAARKPEIMNDTSITSIADSQTYQEPSVAPSPTQAAFPENSGSEQQPEEGRPSSQSAKIDRAGLSPGPILQAAPKQIVPDVQFPSHAPYDGTQLPPWAVQIPQNGVIYPYARFWRKK